GHADLSVHAPAQSDDRDHGPVRKSKPRNPKMSSFKVFDIAGSGMSAESVRLNTVASNLANADSVSGDPTQVYQAKHPVFQSVQALGAAASQMAEQASASVR